MASALNLFGARIGVATGLKIEDLEFDDIVISTPMNTHDGGTVSVEHHTLRLRRDHYPSFHVVDRRVLWYGKGSTCLRFSSLWPTQLISIVAPKRFCYMCMQLRLSNFRELIYDNNKCVRAYFLSGCKKFALGHFIELSVIELLLLHIIGGRLLNAK